MVVEELMVYFEIVWYERFEINDNFHDEDDDNENGNERDEGEIILSELACVTIN